MGAIAKQLNGLGYRTATGAKLKPAALFNRFYKWQKANLGSTESVVAQVKNPTEATLELSQGALQNFIWKNMSNKSRTELLTQFVKNNS
jgi:hypothetical protein